MEFLAWVNIYRPDWAVNPAILSVFSEQATISTSLGFWCLVSGMRLFREEEYAMGMELVVLSIMVASGIMTMISWVRGSFEARYLNNSIIGFIIFQY